MNTESKDASMSPEAQRIAIAEACGWRRETLRWVSPGDSKYALRVSRHGQTENIPDCDILPDYLEDLNAMNCAEKVLTEMQYLEFTNLLHDICDESWRVSRHVSATASQRAEAFLRTLGKWTGAK